MPSNVLKNEISWQIEEQPMSFKNNEWFWALAIVGFAIVIFSVMMKNYLLIIIIALAGLIIYALKNKPPELHRFKLNSEGLYINEKLYAYENFESFWIFSGKEIAFRRKHNVMPLLIVPLQDQEESGVRKIISNYLPESEEKESFLDLVKQKFF